jgi:ChrR Cupin-like domain
MLAGCASATAFRVDRSDVIGPCQTAVPDRDVLFGVALSGGGSRAALFGEAGLEALARLRTADGASVIDKISHLSSVSGGSIAAETGREPLVSVPQREAPPEWEEAAPGIFCKLLATDTEQDRVSMLVRLAPGVAYPPHRHAGVEELYLLDGELWIEDKKLYPGDYNRAEPGTDDQRVWSETGCTCVLITSTRDLLR